MLSRPQRILQRTNSEILTGSKTERGFPGSFQLSLVYRGSTVLREATFGMVLLSRSLS